MVIQCVQSRSVARLGVSQAAVSVDLPVAAAVGASSQVAAVVEVEVSFLPVEPGARTVEIILASGVGV